MDINLELKKSLVEHNPERLEDALYFLTQDNVFSKANTEVLCELLLQDWHFSHETIAHYLQQLKDPFSIPYLAATATKRFEYLAYDDTYQLARKCIKALAAIGTKEAISSLNNISMNENSAISGYASKELIRIK
ncbi:hypothetical protein Q5H93_23535 [Hymenobacter sp. ASUV-10]|uniref:HEAT repeat domain-containing protein n=1 Tax=Hymenobacter aranciens TaxID=3063996 RepID=A0ABT9BHJ1_9BACT|nr:hypothetical protein [Hymenobacter sp. ASUV-10]MDO7877729.1 hypothetical protein [Hymenobacter sp. ASUV-10]